MGYKVLANFLELSLIPFAASSLQLGVFFFSTETQRKKTPPKSPRGTEILPRSFFLVWESINIQ